MAKDSEPTSNGKCGIVMPISECDGCTEAHWSEVKVLIERAAKAAGFDAEIVSEADDVGVIQKRIVQNLYECPVVVCDISGRNANVMFELGMRLAFDKPTIVIKDDKTPFSFDTSPLETITYPRDLRYSKIEEFQKNLTDKIGKTFSASGADSFLKSFGSFRVVELDIEKGTPDQLILDEIHSLKQELRFMRTEMPNSRKPARTAAWHTKTEKGTVLRFDNIKYNISKNDPGIILDFEEDLARIKGVKEVDLEIGRDIISIEVTLDATTPNKIVERKLIDEINRFSLSVA